MSNESNEFRQTVKDTMRDVKEATNTAVDKGRGMAAVAQEKVSDAGASLRKTADRVGSAVSEGYDKLSDRAGDGYEYVRDSAKTWEGELESLIKNRPLAAALASVGIGVAIGLLFHARSRH